MKLSVCLMAMLLAGCATTGVVTNNYCDVTKPIYVSKSDVFTDGTARQILEHNETWKRICK
jgi:hypothetical protein